MTLQTSHTASPTRLVPVALPWGPGARVRAWREAATRLWVRSAAACRTLSAWLLQVGEETVRRDAPAADLGSPEPVAAPTESETAAKPPRAAVTALPSLAHAMVPPEVRERLASGGAPRAKTGSRFTG